MEKTTVSVITPTKNRCALLCETIDSITAQTFVEWEHIIVDDGSDDDTAKEVAKRAAADSRIRYIKREGEKSGANVCRNAGLRESHAELIIFLDSDDLLAPGCLEHRVKLMQRNMDLDFAVWQAGVFKKIPGDFGRDIAPGLTGNDLLCFLFFECPWYSNSPIWRKAALDRIGAWDEALISWQDIDLHVRAICAGLKYLRFSEIDHHIRWSWDIQKTSVLQCYSPKHLEAAPLILEKFEGVVRDGPGMDWSRQRALCSLYFFVAERWAEAGDFGQALRTWRIAYARGLASFRLHAVGVCLMWAKKADAAKELVRRLINKWKGWMRMRTNPGILAKNM